MKLYGSVSCDESFYCVCVCVCVCVSGGLLNRLLAWLAFSKCQILPSGVGGDQKQSLKKVNFSLNELVDVEMEEVFRSFT